jgi:hypothetical protein
MHLVEIFLPVTNNHGRAFGRDLYEAVRDELTGRFGGMTAFARAPAHGETAGERGVVVRDDIVIFEVMTQELDAAWWSGFRKKLEFAFAQDEILIRASSVKKL